MSYPLRKSTASQVFQFVMVDSTTALPKTGLSIANTDIKLIFQGGTTQTSKNSGGATEIGSTGTYYCTFDATDTATLGSLHIDIQKSGALPFFKDAEVLNTALWDALYASSGGAIPNVATSAAGGILTSGTSTAQINPSAGAVPIQSGTATGQVSLSAGAVIIQSGTGTGQVNLSAGNVGLQSGTNANQISLSGGAVLIQSGTNTGQIITALGAGRAKVWFWGDSGATLDASVAQNYPIMAIGDAQGGTNWAVRLSPGTGTGQVDLNNGQMKVQSGTSSGQINISGGAVTIQNGTAAGQIVLTNGVVQATGTSGGALMLASSYTAPDNTTIATGAASAASAATSAAAGATSAAAAATSAASAATSSAAAATSAATAATDAATGATNTAKILSMTSGTGTNRLFLTIALSNAPSGSSDPAAIADAVWDEALGGHATSGSSGKALSDAAAGSVGAGTGTTPVDHDGGAGVTVDGDPSDTDILRYLKPDTSGANGLTVSAYLVSEYDDSPPVRSAKGVTRTGADGRWSAPLMLDSGTYYVIADTDGDGFAAKINTVVVP